MTGEQAGMLRHLGGRYVQTATQKLSRYGRSRCEQMTALDSCVAGYTETRGWVFPRLNLVPALASYMCLNNRSRHSSLLSKDMLFHSTLPCSRSHFRTRASIQTSFILIFVDVRWSWHLVHFQLVAIGCSSIVTFANGTEN